MQRGKGEGAGDPFVPSHARSSVPPLLLAPLHKTQPPARPGAGDDDDDDDDDEEGGGAAHAWLSLLNRGPLPYAEVAIRGQPVPVARAVMPVLVECGDWTGCRDPDCGQRVAQRGLRYRLEVFRTE